MSVATAQSCHLQRHPSVRLRREAWGGIAFDRASGDLLELDEEGFAVLVALGEVHTLRELRRVLAHQGHAVSLSTLAAFLESVERQGFVQRVSHDAPGLPVDAREAPVNAPSAGLRAPLVAHWAVTYRCNLHCAFCYAESSPERSLGPEAALRCRVVERLAAWGVLEVALGGGEPTILPDFPELLSAIRGAGMVPNVTTNGTVQRPAVVRALAEHAGVVHLSADRPDLLDVARGVGVFDRLRETAQLLRAAGVRLGVNLLLTPANVDGIRASLETALALGVQGVTFLRPKGPWAAAHWPGFPSAADLETLGAALRAFLATRPPLRLYVDTALRGEWVRLGLLDDPEPEVLGCGGGQRHVAVTPDGQVYPCSHLRRPGRRLGDLLRDDLEVLWARGSGYRARQDYLADCAGATCPCCRGQ